MMKADDVGCPGMGFAAQEKSHDFDRLNEIDAGLELGAQDELDDFDYRNEINAGPELGTQDPSRDLLQGQGTSSYFVDTSTPGVGDMAVGPGEEPPSKRRRGRPSKEKQRVPQPVPPPQLQPLALPTVEQLSIMPDKSYYMPADLAIIGPLRAFISMACNLEGHHDQLLMIPYLPIQNMAEVLKDLVYKRVLKIDRESQHCHSRDKNGKGKGHGMVYHIKSRKYSAAVGYKFDPAANPMPRLAVHGKELEAMTPKRSIIQYFVGEYDSRDKACRAADRLKIKMHLSGASSSRTDYLNFDVEDYIEDMQEPGVQFTTDYLSYREHVLNENERSMEDNARVARMPSYRGVFKQLNPHPSGLQFEARFFESASGKRIVLGRGRDETEAGMVYDTKLISSGLFLRPRARHHIPNFPLSLYRNEILDYAVTMAPCFKNDEQALATLVNYLFGGSGSSTQLATLRSYVFSGAS